MSTASLRTPKAAEPTKRRVELARYSTGAGERVIYGQRVAGVVRLTDVPARGRGRRYLIERGLHRMTELEAIVADYLLQAAAWDRVPAAGPCCLAAQIEQESR